MVDDSNELQSLDVAYKHKINLKISCGLVDRTN